MKERAFTLTPSKTLFIRNQFGEQTRLSGSLGISVGRLAHYLCGRRPIPESLFNKLCRATDKKPSDFLDSPAEQILADASFSA